MTKLSKDWLCIPIVSGEVLAIIFRTGILNQRGRLKGWERTSYLVLPKLLSLYQIPLLILLKKELVLCINIKQ